MFEHQKASPDSPLTESKVDVGEELQREFDLKHPARDESWDEMKALLKFSNEQIKSLNQELKKFSSNHSQEGELMMNSIQ